MSISNLLKIHRGLMSSFSDNLPACYAYADNLFAVFAEGFILPIQRAIFMLFPFGIFFVNCNVNFYVSPIQIKYISGGAMFYVFTFFFVFM